MIRPAILAAGLALLAGSAQAIDYASVARNAILFETSSLQARKLAIIRPGTPVEVVVTSPDLQWVKVRDPSGAMSWIEGNALSKQRTVLVTAEQVAVRREANERSPVVFEAVREVVLELVSSDPSGWVKVQHASGDSGFLRSTEVWGL
ncbi:MAG: SH3 domain-containing protein [Proteobacteria bacterium]|jgi:SH3-like domain-containing protein|nr:SH3 domain-containing protein [Pseudomonadota bacterium]